MHRDVRPAPGVFDPEREYGAFPDGVRARPESSLARAERKRGISVPEIACPTLVVYGEEFPDERGRRLVERYGARELALSGKSHWDLVRDPDAIRAVAREIADSSEGEGRRLGGRETCSRRPPMVRARRVVARPG